MTLNEAGSHARIEPSSSDSLAAAFWRSLTIVANLFNGSDTGGTKSAKAFKTGSNKVGVRF